LRIEFKKAIKNNEELKKKIDKLERENRDFSKSMGHFYNNN